MNARIPNNKGMSFPQFMQMMKGKNPRMIIDQLMQNGKITQQDINLAQQMLNDKRNDFDEFRSMFGF